jgi:hypothetical protein
MTVYADLRHLDHLCCVDSGTASLRWHDPQYHDQVVRFPPSRLIWQMFAQCTQGCGVPSSPTRSSFSNRCANSLPFRVSMLSLVLLPLLLDRVFKLPNSTDCSAMTTIFR